MKPSRLLLAVLASAFVAQSHAAVPLPVKEGLGQMNAFDPHQDPWRRGPIPWRYLAMHFGPLPYGWRSAFAILGARHPAVWDIPGDSARRGGEIAPGPERNPRPADLRPSDGVARVSNHRLPGDLTIRPFIR